MRYSQYLLPTLKENPSEAELISHRLMLRAGFMRRLAAGVYIFLPLGYRVIKKIEQIIREEMDKSGALEVFLPVLSPAELWQESGRWDLYGPELMRIQDRHNRPFCLGPTHEEVITELVRGDVRSYRQLPLNLYQIQTKFRDEIRPRFGIMRAREFLMKDGYSFDRDLEGARKSYQAMSDAYEHIFRRCGLEYRAVEADSGPIGGDVSQEFMVLADSGEDKIVVCDSCRYAANLERARTRKPPPLDNPPPFDPREKVHTPNLHTIEEVSGFLKCQTKDLVKTLIIKARYVQEEKTVVVLIRGDHELNETKLKNHLKCNDIAMADADTVVQVTGAAVGFAGPVGLKNTPIFADEAIRPMVNFVTGANLDDYHFVNVNLERDFNISPDNYGDFVNVREGDQCPECKGEVKVIKGIEVGHIFVLGTKYSAALSCNFLDENGQEKPMVMGCYGIGVGRTAAAAVEQNHDENGIIWPYPIAPFQVLILPLDVREAEVMNLSESLYKALSAEGVDVLLDDRDERPGGKFKDADLVGIPLRVTIGARDLKKNLVEIKERKSGAVDKVESEKVLQLIREKIRRYRESSGC